jgi:hypothetical protein
VQVTEGEWKLTRADQIGHWVEALSAPEEPASGVGKMPAGNIFEGNDDPEVIRDFLRLPSDWNLPRPGMIFSVTGSANSDFDLDQNSGGLGNWFKQRLHQFLARVIFGVAIKTKGWIIDGGSNVGIMKALGDTREYLMYPPSVPLIGIASHFMHLPDISERDPQDFNWVQSQIVKDNDKKAKADRNHSHFFFIRPKSETALENFGDENVFRRNFEVCDSFTFLCVGVHWRQVTVVFILSAQCLRTSCIRDCFIPSRSWLLVASKHHW